MREKVCVCVREKQLSVCHSPVETCLKKKSTVNEPLIVQAGICCRMQVCFHFLVDRSARFLAFKDVFVSCVYIVKGYIYPWCEVIV